MMTDEEQHELKDAAIATLVKVACRTSASYEYEIDVLRGALQSLVNCWHGIAEHGGEVDSYDWAFALDEAQKAIERTDWRAPDSKAEGGT